VSEVDSLRQQLRDRGYLTHGIERWFALDPFRSRAFWLELVMVALKAATLIAAFAALPFATVMQFRNPALHALETLGLFVTYGAASFVAAFVFVIAIALVLKLRPALAIDTPRALLAISLASAAVLVAPVAIWWARFDTAPSTPELVAGAILIGIAFIVATIVVSAALLSFSIYELHRVPAIHQKPRTIPLAVAAAALIALLFVPAYARREPAHLEPMVVTTPVTRRIALIAVDGLTHEILQSRTGLLPHVKPIQPIGGASTTERWATLGTGVPTSAHGVRAIEGVRFRGGSHVLQTLSRGDFVLLTMAPALGIARREPLPPTVRRRDYVWELVAERGMPALSVNWWTTDDRREGALASIGPSSIFASSRGDALRLDASARMRFLRELDQSRPQFATVYLPALDVVLNRLPLDETTRLTQSLGALAGLAAAIEETRRRGYEIVVVGLPGDGQRGSAVVASSVPLPIAAGTDVAPTLLDLLGFPASDEMPGGARSEPRIASYGNRAGGAAATRVDEDYYKNLKSLGYIR
jgi:hypothetical protein